jgi:hypothetical protein
MFGTVLYILTGLLTAYQSGFTGGFRVNVPLIGACVLIIAGIVSWGRPQLAGRLALVGSIALWTHYGPALVSLLQLVTNTPGVAIDWMAQLPTLLLVLTSFIALFYTVA